MVRAGASHFSILYPTNSSKKMYSNVELEVMEDQVSDWDGPSQVCLRVFTPH